MVIAFPPESLRVFLSGRGGAMSVAVATLPISQRRLWGERLAMRAGIALLVLWLTLTIALPLWTLLSKSFQDANGNFVGLANYIRYFSTPTLFGSIFNGRWSRSSPP